MGHEGWNFPSQEEKEKGSSSTYGMRQAGMQHSIFRNINCYKEF
jgi:hypothetical protein